MGTTKTWKIAVMICAGIICLQGYAAAGQDVQEAKANAGSTVSQDAEKVNPEGIGNGTVVTAILGYIGAPWCVIPAVVTVNTGIGMIVNALVPEESDRPGMNRAVEQVAHNDAETKTIADFEANDRN